ncbi:MAG TPA: ATP-binding protein [Steroidobacteraceae bacterium]|nr:ATP-binding protein [Steroidobacteraceae bacterium]
MESLRAANAALKEQLALRDHALDATSSLFVITRQTGPEPIIVYCNKAIADQHGFAREELLGKSVALLTHLRQSNPENRPSIIAALRAGDTYNYEDEVTRRDGSRFWVGISLRPIFDATGQLSHAVGIGADITAKREEARKKQELQDQLVREMQERERMVLELQLSQKLESVGRLAAGIAHEINTPIQYVFDSVHFLRSAYEDLNQLLDGWHRVLDTLPEQPEYAELRAEIARLMELHDIDFARAEVPKAFERTFHGIERVTTIVKAMKEFAHPDSDEQSPADLNHALQTTLLVASNEYKYHARVLTEFSELPAVTCNIGGLNQVFLNLLVNAAHAIQDAGKDLTTGEIKISTSLEGDAAVIRISDNGCGVPPEHLSKLYDPFFTTKDVGRGTGQGLAITHSILVDKHGGDISVSSRVGVGTEFVLRLPVFGRAARSTAA